VPETLQKARRVVVHDDGPCQSGAIRTPLINGYCPSCGYDPNMQNTAIMLTCPNDNTELSKDGSCPRCRQQFDISHD